MPVQRPCQEESPRSRSPPGRRPRKARAVRQLFTVGRQELRPAGGRIACDSPARGDLMNRSLPSVFVAVGIACAVGGARVARTAPARKPATAPAAYFVTSAASLAGLGKTLRGKGGHAADLLNPGAT